MSPRSWRLRIQDILEAMADIGAFTNGLTAETFQTDKKTYLAVIRCLEVIGEAANHVPEAIQEKYADVPWRKMKDMRNVLTHEYFGVDNQILWKTISRDLFPLRGRLEAILDSESGE